MDPFSRSNFCKLAGVDSQIPAIFWRIFHIILKNVVEKQQLNHIKTIKKFIVNTMILLKNYQYILNIKIIKLLMIDI